jgi:hypothetical protein
MEHSTVRKLIRAAALSLLVLTTTSGVAGLGVMAAGSATAQPDDSAGGSALRMGSDQLDPLPTPTPIPTPTPTPDPPITVP